MKQNFRVWLMGGVFVSGFVVAPTPAQNKPETSAVVAQESAKAKKNEDKKAWSLNVSNEARTLIGLKAEEAPLAELAQDLARQLGAPVRLSPVMEQQRITIELSEASVETAMRTLAPQVYLDETVNYQNGVPDAASQQLLGVFLSGVNEARPDRRVNLKEQTETVLFLGTIGEEGAAVKPEEEPLRVKLENGLLSVRARRQPVAVVLYEIAQQYGIPFELRAETEQLIDLDLQSQRLENVLSQIAAPVQLTRRLNLSLNESEPLRIILLAHQAN